MPQIVTCGSEFLRINAQKNSIEYSSNGGRTWHNRFCMSSVGTFRDLLVMGADLFAATSKGLYWSRNGGATWVTRYSNPAAGWAAASPCWGTVRCCWLVRPRGFSPRGTRG